MHFSIKKVGKTGLILSLMAMPFFISGKKQLSSAYFMAKAADSAAAFPGHTAVNTVALQAQVLNDSLDLDKKGLSEKALEYALRGYNTLMAKGLLDKGILSICDFSQSSRKKRLYIIDVKNKKLVLNTYVAHGRNSGAEFANSFSNKPESLKSSLGFYLTKSTYQGGHGLSLKIQGLEKGYNDKADFRNIVVHGSEYVGPDFLKYNNCCGRSYGCPAIPSAETALVIKAIKNGSCLFIYHPDKGYLRHSKLINS
ncbi:MAG: murein L,D-transpeptidase catalytic domain family protein [Chitinophagaceae bacterium]